jgi:hypothetical protein
MFAEAGVTDQRSSAHAFPSARSADIESREAVLRAILVDLEARAKYAKLEGVAVPLLIQAKSLNDELRELLESVPSATRSRFEPGFRLLHGQLRAVAMAFAHLCRSDARPRDV